MIDWIYSAEAWSALLTLTALEIVLGIDNVIFLSILTIKLPAEQAKRARQIGLSLALLFRLILLSALVWIIGLTKPVFSIANFSFSWRDIILIVGGLFLIAKGTHEIHGEVEHDEDDSGDGKAPPVSFGWVILQIIVVDIVFSLDSIITAIGMTQNLPVMILAVIIAMIVMYLAAGQVADFVSRHPTTKMLALAFLLLIGVALVADGFGMHIPRGYIYFAIAFSVAVETFNILARSRRRKKAAKSGATSGSHS